MSHIRWAGASAYSAILETSGYTRSAVSTSAEPAFFACQPGVVVMNEFCELLYPTKVFCVGTFVRKASGTIRSLIYFDCDLARNEGLCESMERVRGLFPVAVRLCFLRDQVISTYSRLVALRVTINRTWKVASMLQMNL